MGCSGIETSSDRQVAAGIRWLGLFAAWQRDGVFRHVHNLLISARKRSVIVRSGRSGIFVTLCVLALTIDATAFHFTLTSKNSFIFQSLIVISFVA